MTDSSSDRSPVESLAEEFVERLRRGEHAEISDYTRRYPEHARAIRDLFPLLLSLEDAATTAPDETEPRPPALGSAPERIGDYRIVREIGRGGMGVVYEAEQESLGRRVALKVLPRQIASSGTTLDRFRREARAAAKLHHTNIVPVFDVGQDGSTCFYAMQFIRGQPLSAVIEELRRQRYGGTTDARAAHVVHESIGSVANSLEGSFGSPEAGTASTAECPIDDRQIAGRDTVTTGHGARLQSTYFQSVARLGRQVADGLAHAHSRGVLHRDIKPSNLLMDTSGVVWIADFGTAKVDGESLTHTGDILGTLRYMAPEQFQGECDARADLYALGLTMYELLVFQPAFQAADRLMLVRQISDATPPSPRSLDRQIPRDLETIVLKAIDKNPDKRYQSAEALSDDLQRFIDNRPILARRVGPVERIVRWTRRNPVVSGLSIILAVLLVAAAVISTITAYRFGKLAEDERDATARALLAEKQATQNFEKARSSAAQAAKRAEALRRQDYISRVNLASFEARNDNAARALELLEGCPEDLRGWEWDFVRGYHQVALRSWEEADPSVNVVAFSPREDLLAIGTGKFLSRREAPGHLMVRDTRSGEVVFERRELPAGLSAVAFDPTGSRIASGSGANLTVWDLKTRSEVFSRSAGSLDVLAVAFQPNGNIVAAGYGAFNRNTAGYARLWDATTGDEVGKPFPGQPGGVWSLAFHPDGNQLALTGAGLVEIWDLETHKVSRSLTGHEGFVYAVAYDSSGTWIATGGLDRSIRLWDARSGALVRTFVGHTGFVRGLAFSPAGRQLVSASEDKTVRLWNLESERETAVFRGHMHFVNCVSFGRDGRVFASGSLDRTVKLWFADEGHQLVYQGHLDQGHTRAVAFSPLGGAIASGARHFGRESDRLQLWDSRTGAPLVTFPKNVGEVAALSFRPDGKRIAAAHPDESITIWDAATGRLLTRLRGHIGSVLDVTYSPDGALLASAGLDSGVNLWQAESGRLLRTAVGHDAAVGAVAFSPDASLVASGSEDGTARIWETETGRELHKLTEHQGEVRAVVFSPDGQALVSVGGIDHRLGEVFIWDVATGELIRRLRGHTDVVYDAAYSPSGQRLATGSDDRTIKLWNPETGEEMFALRGHTGGVLSVAFSPDGRQIASGSVDRSVRVWSVDAADAGVRYARAAVAIAASGRSHYEARRWDAALRDFDEANRLGIDSLDLKVRRAAVSIEQAPDEERLAVTGRVAASIPGGRSLTELAMELVRFRRLRSARAVAERLTEEAPGDGSGFAVAGRVYALLGEKDRAQREFARSVEIAEAQANKAMDWWWETGWWVTGPFKDQLRDPTLAVEDESPYAPEGATRAAPGGPSDKPSPVSWSTTEKDGDGYLDFARVLGGAGGSSAYAIEYVHSPRERRAALVVDAADTILLWLNRELVYQRTAARATRSDDSVVAVTLHAGWNSLAAKVVGRDGAHGMYVEISDRAVDLAHAYAARRQFAEVKMVWDEAADAERDDPRLLEVTGNVLARRGEWRDAAPIFQRLTRRQPVRNLNWVTAAPLLLEAGDTQAYRENRRELIARFGRSENPLTLDRTGKACLLLPDTPENCRVPAELAARAATIGAGHRFAPFFILAKGMGEYRIGESARACATLEDALERNADRDPYLTATASLFLAMAYKARDLDEKARGFMDRASTIAERRFPTLESGDIGPGWLDWLICAIVRREAEAVLAR